MEIPTREKLKKNKVVELKKKLSKLGLPQGGIKDDLITRLINHYEQEAAKDEPVVSPTDVPGEEIELNNGDNGEPPSDIKIETHYPVSIPLTSDTHLTQPDISGVVQSSQSEEEEAMDTEEQSTEPVREKQLTEEDQSTEQEQSHDLKESTDAQVCPPIKSETVEMDVEEAVGDSTPVVQNQQSSDETEQSVQASGPNEELDTEQPTTSEELTAEQPTTSDELNTEQSTTSDESQGSVIDNVTEHPPSEQEPVAIDNQQLVTEPEAHEQGFTQEMALEQLPEAVSRASQPESLPQQPYNEPESLPSQPNSEASGSTLSVPQVTSDYYSSNDNPKEDTASVGVNEKGLTQSVVPDTKQDGEKTEQTSGEKGKKKKKKKRRRRRHDQTQKTPLTEANTENEKQVEIEYVQEDILKPDDPNYRQFHKIFEAFKITEAPPEKKDVNMPSVSELVAKAAEASKRLAAQQRQDESDDEEEEMEKEAVTMTKKKLRKLNRLSVAQLKQLVERPDVVEMHDVTAHDPKLLIQLKSTRNTVPVPRHWCFKRKYLQGKRGIEKPPFNLPDFIKATGVMEMRQAVEEKEDAKSLKQKTRERVRPKMGKLTIDYQKLHDAFFKWQTKPKMSTHGELYYEGKEFETRLKQKKPGDLSDDLRRALGMPVGPGKQKFPPPWLVAMQRYGPPPSYPHLKIPGLNSPIPEGCSFGYFVGGWGKPPVDEVGRPLYGDVFGLEGQEMGGANIGEDDTIDMPPWGALESEEEESEEESEEEPESPKPEDIQAGLVTPLEGLVTPSGLTSIPAGLETPEMIQLRKKKIEEAMEQGGETPALYTVLPEKAAAVGGAMMGSAHVYDLGAAVPGATKKTGGTGGDGVEVALDPSELDLDTATMTARYEEQMKEQNVLQKEDLSDMVAEHAARQKKRKRAAADSGGGKSSKKIKEFKF